MKNLSKCQKYWLYKRKFIRLLVLKNYYKLNGIDLWRQANASIPQQINFVGKLGEDDGAIMLFIAEKQQKIILNFYLDFINWNRII